MKVQGVKITRIDRAVSFVRTIIYREIGRNEKGFMGLDIAR